MVVVAAVCVVMGSVQALPMGAPVNMTVPSMNNGLKVSLSCPVHVPLGGCAEGGQCVRA